MNTALSAIGFSIQTGQGAAATQPEFWHGVDGGKLVDFSIEQKADGLTSGMPAGTGEYREAVMVGADCGTRAWPVSIVALFYAALGAIETTGAQAPFDHTVTVDADQPWATLFGQMDEEFRKADDCKLDEITIEWDGNGPIKVKETWAGCEGSYASEYTPVSDETLEPYIMPVGGTFTVDLDGNGEDCSGKVLGGKISVKRNLTSDVYSGSLTAGDIYSGIVDVEAEVKYRVPDLTALRLLVTGTVNGTEPTAEVPYGGFDFGFVSGTDTFALAATRVAWKAETPAADPKGGPAELTLKGKCYMTDGGSPLTVTASNSYEVYQPVAA